jgi:hypothetical protein
VQKGLRSEAMRFHSASPEHVTIRRLYTHELTIAQCKHEHCVCKDCGARVTAEQNMIFPGPTRAFMGGSAH